jgi:hypothetical protein
MYADEMLVLNLVLYVLGICLFASVVIWKQGKIYQLMLLYLAVCWGYIGGIFLKQYYVPLNPLVSFGVYAFYAQAVALFCYALYQQTVNVTRVKCLLAGLLILMPLFGIAWGIPYMKAQMLGAGPDSLMLLTLLILSLQTRNSKIAKLLYLIPVSWVSLSFLTFLGLGDFYIEYGVLTAIFCFATFFPLRTKRV